MSYQKAEVGAVVEASVSPGETMEQIIKAAIKRIAPEVEAQAEAAIREAVRLSV